MLTHQIRVSIWVSKMDTYYARLVYFKSSGKYYTEAKLELLPEEIKKGETKEADLALMYMVSDRVKSLAVLKNLPGISSNWHEEGYIYIDCTEIGYPVLLQPNR